MNRDGLDRLARMAGLLRDQRLADLRRAEALRQRSQDQIAGLTRPDDPSADLPALRARLLYDIWADRRRQELLAVLADQTAARDRARDSAAQAAGRDNVIGRLRGRY